jgi:hypothetical protein
MTKTWTTSYGSHQHTDKECANQRRSIVSGSVVTEAPADCKLPMCEHCVPAEIRSAAPVQVSDKCAGGYVADANPKHSKPRGTCPTCGKNVAAARKGRMAASHK